MSSSSQTIKSKLNQFNINEIKSISKQDISKIESELTELEETYLSVFSNDRNEILKRQISITVKHIDQYLSNQNALSRQELAYLYFIKSLVLDKAPEYTKTSEECANKSLKLNPFICDSYIFLANVYWKKGDVQLAISYFKQALEIDEKDKTSIRSLSLLVRSQMSSIQVKEDKENKENERHLLANESLEYAKKAVDIDKKDPESWYVLGNAYFHYAFSSKDMTEMIKHLQKAVICYNMSEKYQEIYKNPDLYYNRSTVYIYLEKYNKAYTDLINADNIDPTLKASDKASQLTKSMINTYKLIKTKCGFKYKKLISIQNSIPSNLKSNSEFEITFADMFGLRSSSSDSVSHVSNASTKKKLISAKIIGSMKKLSDIPLSFICMDSKGNVFLLSIYNLSKDFIESIKIGFSNIVVLEPDISLFRYDIFGYKHELSYVEYVKVSVVDLSKLILDGSYCFGFSSLSKSSSTFFV